MKITMQNKEIDEFTAIFLNRVIKKWKRKKEEKNAIKNINEKQRYDSGFIVTSITNNKFSLLIAWSFVHF